MVQVDQKNFHFYYLRNMYDEGFCTVVHLQLEKKNGL